MENFRQIAEDCLAGKLSGTFVIDKGKNWHSSYLQRHTVFGHEMPGQYVLGPGIIYNEIGQCEGRERVRIIDFIPDNTQEQIKIDIPEGKVPVMKQTENEVVITWKEKELTYEDIVKTSEGNFPYSYVRDLLSLTGQQAVRSSATTTEDNFYKKVEVLRKLINIRNYFGKPKNTENGFYINMLHEAVPSCYPSMYASGIVAFAKREHAEQAIKMLGDELNLLFEPW